MRQSFPSSERPKILFIARRFPPSVGGMERFAFDLSESLAHEVELIKITYGGPNKWLPVVLPAFFFRACWKLFKHKDIAVIHMQDAVQAPIGWALSKLFRKPYIVVAHGLDITFKNSFYQRVVIPFVRKADTVVSISQSTAEEALSRGLVASKSAVITPGMNDDFEHLQRNRNELSRLLNEDLKGSILLLTTGRLVKRKGVAWFIRNVLPDLVAKDSRIKYLVVGVGEEQLAIERAIQETTMAKNVRLLGRVSDEMRSALYQSVDIFVMPNIIVPGDMEGFGLVVQEAASAGLPVVASGIEGIKDAIQDDKNGFLLESGNIIAFKRKILKLARDENFRQKFGKKARDYTLKEFSWQHIAKQYKKVYEVLRK